MDSSSSSSSEVGSAEDVVQALLEYLVDPLLPLKYSAEATPSLAQQQSVAKQVHAVVLLYNYYQRKRHPDVKFLDFKSFCKLAVTLKPTLMAHMKLMHQSDYTELDDLENQLSVAEKSVMDACNISLVLDASKDVPSIEGWPVSKVAVLLIDSRKENCFLLFSSVTQGVWSVIEKDFDVSNANSESPVEGKHTNKRKRISKKPLRDEQDADDASFRQLAFSAIKEATGIKQTDLTVLESRVVYSLSKEKTAAHFYIVQTTQSTKDLQFPIKEALESLQGPMVKKSSCDWMVTPLVEYYHVLPYAGIVSEWFSRKGSSNSLLDSVGLGNVNVNSSQRTESPCDKETTESTEVSSSSLQNVSAGLGNVNVNSPKRTENPCENEVSENIDSSVKKCDIADSSGNEASGANGSQRTENPCDFEVIENRDRSDKSCGIVDSSGYEESGVNNESSMQKVNNGCHMVSLSNSFSGPLSMDIDDSTVACPQNEDKSKSTRVAVKVYHHQKKRTSSIESNISASISGVNVKMEMADSMVKSCVTECRGEEADTGNKISSTMSSDQDGMAIGDGALVPFQLKSKCVEKLHVTLASKENALSQTALRVLLMKREKLSHQLRNMEDEIALCDKNIETILDGGEDGLALKIETIIDCCNDVCLKGKTQTQDGTCEHVEDQGLPKLKEGKRLSEAILTVRSPCQDLDNICNENKWMLPAYCVLLSDGGFQANVTVKGMDFECSGGSDLHSNPREARETAAARMVAKLQSMAASQTH